MQPNDFPIGCHHRIFRSGLRTLPQHCFYRSPVPRIIPSRNLLLTHLFPTMSTKLMLDLKDLGLGIDG